jgi:hypothetical protein
MTKKLQNIKAIKEMIAGTHRTQTKTTIGFETKDYVRREVGEQWTDELGNLWEQKKGYKVKLGKLSDLRNELKTFPNCPKETCTCKKPSRADEKMKAFHGMCLDCVIDMEHQLKIEGKFKEYERSKILENAKAWLKQAEIEKEILKTGLKAQYILEDGRVEEWEGGISPEELEAKIDAEFEKFKTEFIAKLENGND